MSYSTIFASDKLARKLYKLLTSEYRLVISQKFLISTLMATYFDEHNCQELGDGQGPDHLMHYARLLIDTGVWNQVSKRNLIYLRPYKKPNDVLTYLLPFDSGRVWGIVWQWRCTTSSFKKVYRWAR